MEISKQEIESLRDQDRVKETRDVLGVIANFMAIPLYLLFWIADWIYVPHLKWEFLFVRLLIVPLVLVVQNFSKRAYSQLDSQRAALLFNFGMASAINYMIFRIGDPSTNYYAGLNLVALGNLAFISLAFSLFSSHRTFNLFAILSNCCIPI
jgi:adenylate cyclase